MREFMVPASDEKIAHLAEVTALRQVTDTLGRMAVFMQQLGEDQKGMTAKMGEMHTDIALMKQQNQSIKELQEAQRVLSKRIEVIELLHAEQAGASKFLAKVKDYSPWLVSILMALWAIFERKPG